ncbi:MAG: DUF4364 family protein [Methanotrichaceae archaeon]|nr:DUF4364 family protein [Methanotrichaceae archaeon]
MRTRRSREVIILEILCICQDGQNITGIVHRANTNYATIKAYLDRLVEKGFVAMEDSSSTVYMTTEEGIALRDRLQSIMDAI